MFLFQVTIATLVEEKSPLISILKPIMCQLLNVHLEKSMADSDFCQIVKADIAEVLIEKYVFIIYGIDLLYFYVFTCVNIFLCVFWFIMVQSIS